MPHGHIAADRRAAEETLVFDDGHGHSRLGGAHRGEDARAASAQHANVRLVADGFHAAHVCHWNFISFASAHHFKSATGFQL